MGQILDHVSVKGSFYRLIRSSKNPKEVDECQQVKLLKSKNINY